MTPSIGWDRQLPTVARHRSFPSGPRLSGPAEAEPPTGGSGGLSPVVSICPSALRPRWSRATDRGNRWPVTGHRRKDTGGGESSTRVRRSEWPGDDPLDAGSLEMGGRGRAPPAISAGDGGLTGRQEAMETERIITLSLASLLPSLLLLLLQRCDEATGGAEKHGMQMSKWQWGVEHDRRCHGDVSHDKVGVDHLHFQRRVRRNATRVHQGAMSSDPWAAETETRHHRHVYANEAAYQGASAPGTWQPVWTWLWEKAEKEVEKEMKGGEWQNRRKRRKRRRRRDQNENWWKMAT